MHQILQLVAALTGTVLIVGGAAASDFVMTSTDDGEKADVRAELKAQLAASKDGVIINDTQISYEGGKVIFTAAPVPKSARSGATVTPSGSRYDCPVGWLCLWSSGNFSGSRWQFRDEGYFQY